MAMMRNRSVGFNMDDATQRALYELAGQQKNFSEYVRLLMIRDYQERKQKAARAQEQHAGGSGHHFQVK